MPSMEDYLKKYTSGSNTEVTKKKKKKKESAHAGLKIIEDDAFANVEAARQREMGSDEEREELEVVHHLVKSAKVVAGFKKTFEEIPVIKKEIEDDEDVPRRTRHDSDSPPPRRRHDSDEPSPKRKRKDSDNSPPRKNRRRHDSDNSPPRRKRHDSDNSPPRRDAGKRKRKDSDESPPRIRKRRDSDESPPRNRRRRDSDNSPPRKRHEESSRHIDKPKKIKEEVDEDAGPSERKTLDGKRAGLQSAKDLREESDRLKEKERKMFDDLDENISGRNAETVYRKKQFKKGGKDDEEKKAKKEREAKKTEELKEKYKDMNRGVAQILERKAQLEEMARVAEQPFTRTANDVHMNETLKEDILKDDPMANILLRKRREEKIDRGETVYPQYQGSWNPNRYNIPPGYRWDGVDRSNGFEGQMAREANKRAAESSEFYKAMNSFE